MSSANSEKIKYGLVHSDPRIRRVVKARRYALAWLIWGVSALFVLFQFCLQLSSGEIVTGLMESFSLGAFGGGLLASTYYYIYVILQTPAGMLIDRYGPRRLLTMGTMICSVGCLLFGVAHVWVIAVLGRLMMGGGAAFAFVGSLSLIGKWFPTRRFALMVGIAETLGMTSTVIGSLFLAHLVETVGWRIAMVGAGGLVSVIGFLIWLIVRNTPRKATPIITRPKGMLREDLRAIVKNKVAWVNGLYSGLMFSVVSAFIALWGIPYTMLAHHISLFTSTMVCSMVFVGIAVGSPLLGWIDSWIRDRRYLLAFCALAAAVVLCAIIYLPRLSIPTVIILMSLLGLFISGYVLTFSIANEIVLPERRGASIGFVNMLSVGTAPIVQPLIGLTMHIVATHHGQETGSYTVFDYEMSFLILPVCLLVAACLVPYLPARRVCNFK